MAAEIPLPDKLIPVFTGKARYRGAYGGRGSGKSRSFALMTAIKAYQFAEEGRTGIILCGRQYQNSLEDSSLQEIRQAIQQIPWLKDYFEIGDKYIRTKNRLISYSFVGLHHNVDSIKSKANILVAWIDEAEAVFETAWNKLTKTVREKGSEIWVTWNPETNGSATDNRFLKHPPDNSKIIQMNHNDNPWFPQELEEERINDQERLDPATYAWIWEGAYLENSDAQILSGKVRVMPFEPDPEKWYGPYHGLDYGFAQDPTACVRVWVYDNRLWVENEVGGVGVELDDTPQMVLKEMPDIHKYVIRADNARPESTTHLRSHGLPRVESAPKWRGSVDDGIAHLRSYDEIVVHPRCEQFIMETRMYSYKTDRLTGDILPKPVDAYNHYIDAVRYALSPLIKRKIPLNKMDMDIAH